MSPNFKNDEDFIHVILAEKNNTWNPKDYEEPKEEKEKEDSPSDKSDEKDKEEKESDKEHGIDTSDIDEGKHDLPDEDEEDGNPKGIFYIIFGCIITLFVLILILACCCKKKTYKYK